MHMADAMLSPVVGATMYVASRTNGSIFNKKIKTRR